MPETTIIQLPDPSFFSSDPFTTVLHDGACRLIQRAILAERATLIDTFSRERPADDRPRLVPHGHLPECEVLIRRIVRQTGLSRKLVRQILRGEREDVFRIRESSLTPWLSRLEREWAGGCRNDAELWRRVRADGFQGSHRVVGEWATRQRRADQAMPSGPEKSPPARRIARLLTMDRDHLCKADAIQVARIEAALPTLATARRAVCTRRKRWKSCRHGFPSNTCRSTISLHLGRQGLLQGTSDDD